MNRADFIILAEYTYDNEKLKESPTRKIASETYAFQIRGPFDEDVACLVDLLKDAVNVRSGLLSIWGLLSAIGDL